MRYYFLFILFLWNFALFAQKQIIPLHFEHINTNNGLSNNFVNCIYKDTQGFMWLGTEDGLNRYDGTTIKIFRHSSKDSNSLAGNTIHEITADKYNAGRLWVSCHCGGLSNFSLYSHKCINYKENLSDTNQLTSNCDVGVVYDDAGNTWVKNKTAISLFNPVSKKFTTVYKLPKDSSLIYSFIVDKGIIWMSIGYGVKSFNPATKEVVNYKFTDERKGEIFKPEFVTNNGEIIFSSWGGGICIFNPVTGTQKILLNNIVVWKIKEITLNGIKQLWVGTNRGLFTANISSGYNHLTENSFTKYVHSDADVFSLSNNSIHDIFQDEKGIVWLATENGLDKLNPAYLKLQPQYLSSSTVNKNFLTYGSKEIFAEQDEQGNTFYWIAYWHGPGLFKTDKNFNVVKRINFTHTDAHYRMQDKGLNVSNVFRYGKDTLCIATWDGLWLYNDKQDKLLRNYNTTDEKGKSLKIDYALKDKQGNIWVGTYNQHLQKLNMVSGKWEHFAFGSKAQNSTKNSRCDFMFLDSKQRLWIDEISYYSFAEKKFTQLQYDGSANHIIEDRKGNIWLATDAGLAKFLEETKTFQIYTITNGLKSNNILRLTEDTNGNIWATSMFGLVCLNVTTNTINTFTTADGLPDNNTNQTLIKISSDSLMYFTESTIGKGHYIIFSPKELLNTQKEIPFHFTGISVLNKEKTFEQPIDNIQALNISYKENLFTIYFKALEYGNNSNIRYRYKLNNSKNWTETNQENITFTNLRGGKYLLQLQATNDIGIWMNKTIQLTIIIHPPFWQTRWFMLLMLATAILLATYFVKRRIKNIKAKAFIQQQITELEMKVLKAQLNPHFVFNSLTSIQDSIVHGKIEAAEKYLGKFSKLIRMALMQSSSKTNTLQDELDYLKLYLELEAFRFDDFTYTIHTHAVHDMAFIKIPAMLIQPYIENAIKHGLAHKQGSKNLSVIFEDAEDNMLKVTVEDNGIGRKQSAVINATREASHISMGMKITDERLQLMKEKNAAVVIEDLINKNNEPLGTRVILHIPTE